MLCGRHVLVVLQLPSSALRLVPSLFGADAKSIEDMEKELNALRSSVSNLTEQIESVKSEKAVASVSSDTKEDVEALKNEVTTLKEEMRTAAQAEQTLKAEDIAGNVVFQEFAKR